MHNGRRPMGSEYMEWVKTLGAVRYNLAISGMKNYPLSALPVDVQAFVLSGPGAYGFEPLKRAIAAKCAVTEDCVVTAQGTSMANYLAMATLLSPGDDVLIEHPGYPLLWQAAENLGARAIFFERRPEQNFAIHIDAVAKSITPRTRLIVVTNLHNPSCAFTDAETLREVGDLAKSAGARVLVDEVYLDLLFEDTPPTSFKLGPEFVVTNSLTKAYGLSGLRCGWILAEPELALRMYRLHDLFGVNNPYVTDQLSCLAFEHLRQISKWSRDLLDRNHALANEFVATAQGLTCPPIAAGTVLFPKLHTPVESFCRLLRERYATVVTPGRFFGAPDRIRIGIAGETSVVGEGLNRIREALTNR